MAKKGTKTTTTKSALTSAKDVIDKALKGSDAYVPLGDENAQQQLPHIPTGSSVADSLIGGPESICPGYPVGKVINLYGHEASGKTTLALTAAASVTSSGGTVAYIDWENEIQPRYAAALGVPINDPSKFMLYQPETLEEGLKIIWVMVNAGVDLIVIDSVGAAVSQAVMDEKVDEQGRRSAVGETARQWSKYLPKFKSKTEKTGTTVIAIAQIRDKINTMGYGDSTNVQGGKAWKFYSAIRIKLQRIKQEKGKVYDPMSHKMVDQTIGNVVKIKLEKCKVSPQQNHEATFYIRQGEGVDNLRSIIDVAAAHKVLKKAGAWYSWHRADGTEIRGQGIEKFRESLYAQKGALDELYHQAQMAMRQPMDNNPAEDDSDIFEEITG